MDDGADLAKGSQLVARVESVPLTAVPESFRDDEIRMTVRARAHGVSPAHYLGASGGAPRGRDLVAVVSLGTIDSPDQVQIHEVRLDGDRLFLHVHIRDFQGRLAANVQRLALVIVDLGDLSPGFYSVELQVDRSAFIEHEHPETAIFEGSSNHQLHFEVAGD